jgi:hypothetical protein
MSYIHPSWNYQGHQGIPMDQHMAYDPSMVPPPMMHPIDGYMYPHPPMEMMDYYHQPIMDYDEYTENLSRPRLTKEQVETLEAQFQAHPKPSSNVKRQLAAQTNLSLPRVAVRTKDPVDCEDCDRKTNVVGRTGSKIVAQRPSNRNARRNSKK